MPRTHQRRSSDERVADLEKKIADLKARQAAQSKKNDPLVREIRKLLKQLKRFIQLAYDSSRPDIANSALGFRAILDRALTDEVGTAAADEE